MIKLANGAKITKSHYKVGSKVMTDFLGLREYTITPDIFAVIFNERGEVYDLAYNKDSAISVLNGNSGTAALAIKPKNQDILDNEVRLRQDCWGNRAEIVRALNQTISRFGSRLLMSYTE